jgi:ATP:ADP antiporter, AAA family
MAFLRAIFDIRKGETSKTVGMFFYFFIIIAAFWFLKPLRSALTVEKLGADSIRILKVITAGVSAGVVVAYSLALTRFSRERLVYLILGAFIWLMLFFWFFFTHFGYAKMVYYCFYVFLDLFITVNVAVFWTFLADIMDSESATRLYGLIGAGGVIGGFIGSFTCKSVVETVGPAEMILYVAIAYSSIFFIVFFVSARVKNLGSIAQGVIAESGKSRVHDALEGAKAVFSSRYFLGICGVLGAYELISTVNDFTFHKAVELMFQEKGGATSILGVVLTWMDGATGWDITGGLKDVFGLTLGEGSLKSFFSEFFLALNIIALLVQVILTSLVIRRLGMTVALLFLPVVLVVVSTGYFFFPMFIVVEVLYMCDNSLNYSINQTSREMLFVPVERKAKYRALAFIDMFVLRTAKASGGFLLLILPLLITIETSRDLGWYMLMTVPLGIAWSVLAIFLGRKFHKVSAEHAAASEAT